MKLLRNLLITLAASLLLLREAIKGPDNENNDRSNRDSI